MQESIYQLGKLVYQKENFLLNLIEELPCTDSTGQDLFVAKINFNTEHRTLELDCTEKVTTKTAHTYVYTGNPKANAPQFIPVLKGSVQPLLTQVLYQWKTRSISTYIHGKIDQIIEAHFDYFPNLTGTDRKFSYMLSPQKAGISKFSPQELIHNTLVKDIARQITEQFETILETEYRIQKKRIGLYVLMIDGQPLSQMPEYKRMLLEEKTPKIEMNKEPITGFCSLCRTKQGLTFDTSKLSLKFHTTNQISFASGIQAKNYSKSLLLCCECLSILVAGEKFVKQHLKKRLGRFSVYLLPQVVFGKHLLPHDLHNMIQRIKLVYDGAHNFEQGLNLQNQSGFETEAVSYNLNILVYRDMQQAVKVQKFVKNVALSRLLEFRHAAVRVEERFAAHFAARHMWRIDLRKVYYFIPLRESNGSAVEYRKLLEVYESLFKKRLVSKSFLIEQAVKIARILYFEQTNQYNIGEYTLLYTFLLQYQAYLCWLKEVGCLNEEDTMIAEPLYVAEEIHTYMSEMNFTEEQASLFLLGTLLGSIGMKQYSNTDGKKPILQKLNFHGLDKAHVIRLSSSMLSLLQKYNILLHYEEVYVEHKRLLDKCIRNWQLNKQEALYYILSGYAYETHKAIMLQKGAERNEQ